MILMNSRETKEGSGFWYLSKFRSLSKPVRPALLDPRWDNGFGGHGSDGVVVMIWRYWMWSGSGGRVVALVMWRPSLLGWRPSLLGSRLVNS